MRSQVGSKQAAHLIEQFKDGVGGKYWAGDSSRDFVDDVEKAVQYRRKSDAWRATRGWHWTDIKHTEHLILPPAGTPAKEAQTKCSYCGWGTGHAEKCPAPAPEVPIAPSKENAPMDCTRGSACDFPECLSREGVCMDAAPVPEVQGTPTSISAESASPLQLAEESTAPVETPQKETPPKEFIGTVRRRLFIPMDHEWNGVVRDITAKHESGEMVPVTAVLNDLAAFYRRRATLAILKSQLNGEEAVRFFADNADLKNPLLYPAPVPEGVQGKEPRFEEWIRGRAFDSVRIAAYAGFCAGEAAGRRSAITEMKEWARSKVPKIDMASEAWLTAEAETFAEVIEKCAELQEKP